MVDAKASQNEIAQYAQTHLNTIQYSLEPTDEHSRTMLEHGYAQSDISPTLTS